MNLFPTQKDIYTAVQTLKAAGATIEDDILTYKIPYSTHRPTEKKT